MEFLTLQRDNKGMWHFKIHPFVKPDFTPTNRKVAIRKNCEITGCPHLGEYKAPKSRYELRDYYWFCLDHVREYNANWDFFKGMNRAEIEHHMYKNAVWDRPTWKSTMAGLSPDDKLRQKIYSHFSTSEGVFGDFAMGGEQEENVNEAHIDIGSIPHPTVEALSVLDLAPPIQWEEVRTRYKKLAKKYHPDTNKGDKKAEEQFKKISMAYNILKLSYQHFTELDK